MNTSSRNRLTYYLSMVHYPLKTQQWIERAGRSETVTVYDQHWYIEDIAMQGNSVQFTLVNSGDILDE